MVKRHFLKIFSLIAIISSLPTIAHASENNLSIASYQDSGVGFVGRGHCQWWPSSPFSTQDPHLFAGFLAVLFFGAIVIAWRYSRTPKILPKSDDGTSNLKKLQAEFLAKENRLRKKILDLDEKLANGEIKQPDYDELCYKYKKELEGVRAKIDQFNKLDG